MLRHSPIPLFRNYVKKKMFPITKTSVTRILLEDGGKFVNFLKGLKVNMVNKKLQESHKMIRTCGLHVVVRVFCWQMSNAQYIQYLLSATNCVSPDKLVALMTIIGHM